ncbi:glutathione S-transferase P [Acrasis kona]|uniref:Glutathione S-transferase P n=1 Tax=Acrasis kona TaxID=1008807 RepID=A0AAW2YHZ9_9EUKA
MSTPTITYFSSRGLVEPIRVVLAIADVDYKETGVGPYNVDNQPSGFTSLVAEKKLAFDALPLWTEGEFSITQSQAILRYVSNKYGLAGKGEEERAIVDMYTEGVRDFSAVARGTTKELFQKNVTKWLDRFEYLLNKSTSGFLVGDSITSADALLWCLFDNWCSQGYIIPEEYTAIKAHKLKVEQNAGLQKYLNSGKRYPIQPLDVFKQ